MTRIVLLVVLLCSGCAVTPTKFVAPVTGVKAAADPARVQRDERECAVYADRRPSEIRYATYVACLVSRGYRTQASLVGYGAATRVAIQAERNQDSGQVFRDVTGCASQAGTRVDMAPAQEMFTGAAAVNTAQRAQEPFGLCMARAGYVTTREAESPFIVSGPAIAPAPAPAPTTAPAAPVPVTPSAPPPAQTVPAPATPPGATAAPSVGSPAPTIAAVPPQAARPPRPVKLGLFVDSATTPPVVVVVASNTPAGAAGIRAGDVVLAIDGTAIRSEEDIAAVLATKRPGDVVRIDLQRQQQRISVEATLAPQ